MFSIGGGAAPVSPVSPPAPAPAPPRPAPAAPAPIRNPKNAKRNLESKSRRAEKSRPIHSSISQRTATTLFFVFVAPPASPLPTEAVIPPYLAFTPPSFFPIHTRPAFPPSSIFRALPPPPRGRSASEHICTSSAESRLALVLRNRTALAKDAPSQSNGACVALLHCTVPATEN